MENPVIIALDFENGDKAKEFLTSFEGQSPYVKVGMELFYAEGPSFIKWLKERNFRIFLDLKLHDIPTTVHKAMKVLGGMNVDLVNVHAAGGIQMMKAAKEGLVAVGAHHTKLIAVTQLTSTTQNVLRDELLIQDTSVNDCVVHYAKLAKDSGLDGVVCSVKEANSIKEYCGENFLTVTPGIRPQGSDIHDQARIATPAEAAKMGSDFMVIGRSITQSDQPSDTYQTIINEWRESYENNNRKTFA
ncbi:orotidine-5'-phosphate decarboxylase [Fictibacillus phosphorivorans]|uniref:orotidine-5'-phosphate decarboxylase n=1 Tax=Fictibacillus phosphorivorans TaxID=1221500 RepID=UPI00204203F0|nr:orotidine-5'-phosphate decarboxylase [Fictibacillus phosphorivorans]MCM3717223.1 orotidine-5'-phosphate decarboxylase [Fictibacillus phosphorivorans]MCM3774910.1 orotidine-5'-phosphate decarboxylase [Fictibacillus phosphorivorans]